MATAVETPRTETGFAGPAPWTPWRRVLFRFACAYFVLYYLPFWTRGALLRVVHAAVEWTAAHIFQLTGAIAVYPAVNGSGDTTLDYIHNLLVIVVAAAVGLAWSIFDRHSDDRRLHAWLRIWVRYSLAAILFSYGFAKIFPLQFVPPGFYKLTEPLKDFSPMGLLWTFMGFSPAYTIFAGAAEALGATLLLFRRTTTLGALVSAAVMLNVVMLNFCYDVPVKLFSSNLLLAAIFLIAPDLPRLVRVLVLNQPARPTQLDAILFRTRAARIASVAGKCLFIVFILFTDVYGDGRAYRRYSTRAKPPLYGIWQVDEFLLDGKPAPETDRWKVLLIENPQMAMVRYLDDTQHAYPSTYDVAAHRVIFAGTPTLTFTFEQPDDAHLTLSGGGASIKMERIDPARFLLNSRGFRWINERPFNR